MPPPPRSRYTQSVLPSGALGTSGTPPESGGQGQTIQDLRPQSFWAAITAQPNSSKAAYGFVSVDTGNPPTFTQLTGDASLFGDGVAVAAYEMTGNKSVPTNGTAIVELKPLAGQVGYGFSFAAGSSPPPSLPILTQIGTPTYNIVATDTWETTNALSAVQLESGTWICTLHIGIQGHVSGSAAGQIGVRVSGSGDVGIVTASGIMESVPVSVSVDVWRSVTFPLVLTQTTNITVQAAKSSLLTGGTTWSVAAVGIVSYPFNTASGFEGSTFFTAVKIG